MLEKEWLIEQYKNGKTIRQLAKELKCSTANITIANKSYGVSTKQYNANLNHTYIYQNKEWLEEQFKKHGSVSKIASINKMSRSAITRNAIKFGLYSTKHSRPTKINFNINYFDVIDTCEKAYFLGFIMADGNIYKKPNGKYKFALKIKSTDRRIIYRFAKSINYPNSHLHVRERLRNNTVCKTIDIEINNQHFCESLIKFGIIPRKSGCESMPSSIPHLYIKDFIRGFVDGDGSVSINKSGNSVSMCSMSRSILEDICEYFKQALKIELSITTQKTINNILYIVKTSAKYKMHIVLNHLYYDGCIALERKKKNAFIITNRSALN